MARVFDESDFADEPRQFSESDFVDSVGPVEQAAASSAPFAANLIKSALPAAGGLIGGLLGTVGGPAGAVGGAAIGSSAGEAYRQIWEALRGRGEQSSLGSAGRIAGAGVAGAAGEGIGQGVSAGLRYLGPKMIPTGAQIIRTFTGVPESSAKAALRGELMGAKSVEAAGAAMEGSTVGVKGGVEGLKSLTGKRYISKEGALDLLDEALDNLESGQPDIQKIYVARQQAMKAMQGISPAERDLRRDVSNGINKLDDYIETQLPEWKAARQGYRSAKVAEEFSSLMPQNKNLSPNVLRSWSTLAGGVGAAFAGHPFALAAVPLISPMAWGIGIKAAQKMTPIAGKAGQYIVNLGTQGVAVRASDAIDGR